VTANDEFERLIAALKITVATLRDRGIPFMLGGSAAAWARGGPVPRKDLDLMLKPADAQPALEALGDAGMRTEHPPEEWLYKAWHDDVLVDLIFRPSGLDITDETLGRAETLSVMAVSTPVMNLEDMLVTMLLSIDEHCLDYGALVAIARSLREQIDWAGLRTRTVSSPYAKAFFTLVAELGIAPPAGAPSPAAPRVRVLPSGRR